ncbi:hypothetical protein D3C80_1624120 [compost metagenome]
MELIKLRLMNDYFVVILLKISQSPYIIPVFDQVKILSAPDKQFAFHFHLIEGNLQIIQFHKSGYFIKLFVLIHIEVKKERFVVNIDRKIRSFRRFGARRFNDFKLFEKRFGNQNGFDNFQKSVFVSG